MVLGKQVTLHNKRRQKVKIGIYGAATVLIPVKGVNYVRMNSRPALITACKRSGEEASP